MSVLLRGLAVLISLFWIASAQAGEEHAMGAEDAPLTIIEYASLADIDKAAARGNELFLEMYPDEEEREARAEKFTALAGAGLHEDSIVQEYTALTK